MKPTPWKDLISADHRPNVQDIEPKETLEDTVGKPKVYTVAGKDVDFFTTGQLAISLNRKAVTIRMWESNGVIPVTPYRSPSLDKRGSRRLYTREQVEGIVAIAREEGILDETWRSIKNTSFTPKVIELFTRLVETKSP